MGDRQTEDEVEKAQARLEDSEARDLRTKIGILSMAVFDTFYFIACLYSLEQPPYNSTNPGGYMALLGIPVAAGFIYFTKFVVFRNKVNDNYAKKGWTIIFVFMIIIVILTFIASIVLASALQGI